MAFQKAYLGCRPEAQYTYYDGCLLAIRVGHEGAHAARAPSTRDAAEGGVPRDEWMATCTGEVYRMRTSADERYRPVWLNNPAKSCYVAIIIRAQSTQSVMARAWTARRRCPARWDKQTVAQPLRIARGMGMAHVLLDHVVERSFTTHAYASEGVCFDRADAPLTVGVEMGTPRRHEEGLHPMVLAHHIKRLGALRVSGMDQRRLPQEDAVAGVRELP